MPERRRSEGPSGADARGPARRSLIKYDTPTRVEEGKDVESVLAKKKKNQDAISRKDTEHFEDVLHVLLPPREWNKDSKTWRQYVSTMPSNRLDVLNLQDRLDQELKDRRARPLGICPVREELHFQCLDEIIRQVTIACAERGTLLTRVRDELQMTITTYRNLYESAVAFGMRKALRSEQGRRMVEERFEQLEIENGRLQDRLVALENANGELERRTSREKETMIQKHGEEIKFYRRSIDQLNAQVQSLVEMGRR